MNDWLKDMQVRPAHEVVSHITDVPNKSGLYIYFCEDKKLFIPTRESLKKDGKVAIYYDTSPQEKPKGVIKRAGNIRKRISSDLSGESRTCSFRITLGLVLKDELALELSATRPQSISFGDGESRLSDWIREHLHVGWLDDDNPWSKADELMESCYTPLSTPKSSMPEHGGFHRKFAEQRTEAIALAKKNMNT